MWYVVMHARVRYGAYRERAAAVEAAVGVVRVHLERYGCNPYNVPEPCSQHSPETAHKCAAADRFRFALAKLEDGDQRGDVFGQLSYSGSVWVVLASEVPGVGAGDLAWLDDGEYKEPVRVVGDSDELGWVTVERTGPGRKGLAREVPASALAPREA